MSDFRKENLALIYSTNFFGLNMEFPESLKPKKWLRVLIIIWAKIPITFIPVYILWDVRALLFDEMAVLKKFAMGRKVFVFSGFFLKNVIFYWNRKKIERLIDLWDGSFLERFYEEEELIYRKKNQKENTRVIAASLGLAIMAAFSYSVPSFFSKKKVILHPSGIPVPSRSPEYEIAVVFDNFGSFSGISAGAFDCILVVFLSHVRTKLDFLRDRLAYILREIMVDDDGRLLGRRSGPGEEDLYEEREVGSEEFVRNMKNVDRNLRTWIHQHLQAISFFEEITKVYSSIATFQLGTIVVYTGLTALNIVRVRLKHDALGIALVASCNLMSLYLWCKIAGDLRSIDLFGEAFETPWFLYPKKIKTAFSFIINRSKKPLTLYGFSLYEISLVTFYEILKLTYQFFAFMVQMTSN